MDMWLVIGAGVIGAGFGGMLAVLVTLWLILRGSDTDEQVLRLNGELKSAYRLVRELEATCEGLEKKLAKTQEEALRVVSGEDLKSKHNGKKEKPPRRK